MVYGFYEIFILIDDFSATMFVVGRHRLLELQRYLDRHFENSEWIDLDTFRKKQRYHEADWTGLYEFNFCEEPGLDCKDDDCVIKIFEIDPHDWELTVKSYLHPPYFHKVNFRANREYPRISSVNPQET